MEKPAHFANYILKEIILKQNIVLLYEIFGELCSPSVGINCLDSWGTGFAPNMWPSPLSILNKIYDAITRPQWVNSKLCLLCISNRYVIAEPKDSMTGCTRCTLPRSKWCLYATNNVSRVDSRQSIVSEISLDNGLYSFIHWPVE